MSPGSRRTIPAIERIRIRLDDIEERLLRYRIRLALAILFSP
jgi:hypothetical protein